MLRSLLALSILCLFVIIFFVMSAAATAAAESNCNYIRSLQVSTPYLDYLDCVLARPRPAFYSKNSIVCG